MIIRRRMEDLELTVSLFLQLLVDCCPRHVLSTDLKTIDSVYCYDSFSTIPSTLLRRQSLVSRTREGFSLKDQFFTEGREIPVSVGPSRVSEVLISDLILILTGVPQQHP